MLIFTHHTWLQNGPVHSEDQSPVKPEGWHHLQTAIPAQSRLLAHSVGCALSKS